MRAVRMPWDVWLTRAQWWEIAERGETVGQRVDAAIAEHVIEQWPERATDAKFDGKVFTYRGGPWDGLSYCVPQEVA